MSPSPKQIMYHPRERGSAVANDEGSGLASRRFQIFTVTEWRDGRETLIRLG